jgi:two-component system nitrate/nitrite response regulator NarL
VKTRHFFLAIPGEPLPERWREAFPEGQVSHADALEACLRGRSASESTIWLGSADAQWPERLRQLFGVLPGARVVMLSSAPEPEEGLRALNAGVRGYTHAYAVPALLLEVATVIDHGGLWVGPDLLRRLVASTQAALARRPAPTAPAGSAPAGPWDKLTAREMQVARAVSAGRSNREVAALMFISERTVKAHLGVVFEKLGVKNRVQLVLSLAGAPESAAPPGKADA